MSWQQTIGDPENVRLPLLIPETFCSARPVRAAFTTRHGGVSRAPFATLNLGLHVGDNISDVLENRRRLAQAIGVLPESLVAAEQVHGGSVALVEARMRGRGACDLASALPGVDALICEIPDTPLTLYFADCVPVFLFDPGRPAVGLAHAGWRGIAGQVIRRTLEAMMHHFRTDPASCHAAIGPAIGPCCYRVGPEVVDAISRIGVDLEGMACSQEDGAWRLDLPGLAGRQLKSAGIPPGHIECSEECTCCESSRFFSFRRSRRTGRMAAIISGHSSVL